jgi:hypothetical protein
VVIIRPPLVYGPGVKANFRTLLEWIERGVPLPLASIQNKRSLVGLDNLVDLVITCIDHPGAANQTFMVSDNEDLSTPELISTISRAMGKSPRLFPFPVSVLRKVAEWVGRGSAAARLCDSLQVDIRHTMDTLGWRPPVSVEEGVQKTVDDFLVQAGSKPLDHGATSKEHICGGGEMPSGCVAPARKGVSGEEKLRAEDCAPTGSSYPDSAPAGAGSGESDVGGGKELRAEEKIRRRDSAPTKDGASRESGRG